MSRLRAHRARTFVARAPLLVVGLLAVVAGCSNAERARREGEVVALRSDVEELKRSQEEVRRSQDEVKRGQEADARQRARIADEVKALGAQSALLGRDAKTAREELARIRATLEQNESAIRGLRSSVDEALRNAAVAAAPPPSPPPPPKPAPQPPARDVTPERLYGAGMASFRAEEHGQAVLDFTELIGKFPKHPLAPSGQYWIGEAYYRQRDFRQSLAEFQKVVDIYPQSAHVPDALLKIGLCYRALRDVTRARATWEQLAREHPGTDAGSQARSLLSALGTAGRRAR